MFSSRCNSSAFVSMMITTSTMILMLKCKFLPQPLCHLSSQHLPSLVCLEQPQTKQLDPEPVVITRIKFGQEIEPYVPYFKWNRQL